MEGLDAELVGVIHDEVIVAPLPSAVEVRVTIEQALIDGTKTF